MEKMYLLMLATDCRQHHVAINAYQDKDKATEHAEMWNREKEVLARKDANEHGSSYERWVGAYYDKVYVVEIGMDAGYETVRDSIEQNIS